MGVERCFWLILGGRGIPGAAVCPFKGRESRVWKCLAGSSLLADSAGAAVIFLLCLLLAVAPQEKEVDHLQKE